MKEEKEYAIIFDDAGIDCEEFVSLWNDFGPCAKIGNVRVERSPSRSFGPLPGEAVVILSSVAVGIATNAIYDAIKKVFKKKGVPVDAKAIQRRETRAKNIIIIRKTETVIVRENDQQG